MELVLHADVDGSLEALTESLLALNTGQVVFKVVRTGVGAPSPSDVQFAQATGATLVAFGVKVPAATQQRADQLKVPVVASKCAWHTVCRSYASAMCTVWHSAACCWLVLVSLHVHNATDCSFQRHRPCECRGHFIKVVIDSMLTRAVSSTVC